VTMNQGWGWGLGVLSVDWLYRIVLSKLSGDDLNKSNLTGCMRSPVYSSILLLDMREMRLQMFDV